MTSESLNIKLNLDISDITASAKKVKTQLSSMANTVKQSIPKIGTESKKAKESLAKVSDAGDDVSKSIAGIGKEANKSLSGVVAQSNKVTSALNALGIASRKAQTNTATDGLTDSTAEATAGLEELQGTMDDILALNFFGLLGRAFEKSGFKGSLDGVKESLGGIKKAKEEVQAALDKAPLNFKAGDDIDFDAIKKHIDTVGAEIDKANENLIAQKKKLIEKSRALTLSITGLTVKFVALSAAVVAAVAAINALSVSKLAKEMFTVSQQAGFSAQGYQEWAYVLERVGIEATELGEIMKTLNESQVDVIDGNKDMIKAYERLGFTAQEVASMNSEELWNNTIKALQNVENTTERTSIAYKLFSEDTAKLATVLNLSNEETQQLISTYNTLGGAMSKELITNSSVLQGSLVSLRAAWQGLRNTLAQYVIPVIIVVVEWITKAIVAVNTFLKTFFGLDMTPMTENMAGGMDKVSGSIGGIGGAADEATKAVEKLRRTTMGFDELNIVGNPNTPAADTSGTGTGTGSAAGGMANIGGGTSLFAKASEEAEAFKKKMEEFFDKYNWQIKTISTALAGLGVANLIKGLGSALGLGDKFLGVMNIIKGIATSAIVITLQYSLVHKFMESYMDGEGFKNYILGLVTSAIGTGVLYSMWGPLGAVIGLSVTAVASFKAVFDNGGIDSVESGTVAFTGLASAIGAVWIAWKKLKIAELINKIVAFTKAVGGSQAATSALAFIAPKLLPLVDTIRKIGTAIAGAAKGVGAFLAGLSGTTIAIVVAVIAAIASTAYFLYENWEKVVKVTKDFINTNIVPILQNIKDKFGELKDTLSNLGQAFLNAIPLEVKLLLFMIGEEIKKVVANIVEWFKSIDWIKGIGKAFEVVGGIIFGVVSGVIAGAVQMLLGFIDGIMETFTGFVQITSGIIQGIIGILKGDGATVKQAAKDIVDGIVNLFSGLYKAIVKPIKDFVNGVISWCVKLWDELVGHSIIPDMINAIIKWFGKLLQAPLTSVKNFASNTLKYFKGLWSDVKGWFSKNIAPKFTVSYWTGKFNNVKEGARSAFNGLISIVERAVNAIINKINTLSWKIPDWVPVFGGDTFGFNFKTISIPRLATGGIAVGSTIANIGERGREAILPLENNTGWMDQLADRIAARNSTPTRIALIVDGKELGWATINNINAITKQTGGLQLEIA